MSEPLTEKPEVIRDAVRALGPAATLAEGIVQQAALAYAHTLDATRAAERREWIVNGLRDALAEALHEATRGFLEHDVPDPTFCRTAADAILAHPAMVAALRSTPSVDELREALVKGQRDAESEYRRAQTGTEAEAYHNGRMVAYMDAIEAFDLALAATPTPAPDSSLDAAWKAAEAALPEGWFLSGPGPQPAARLGWIEPFRQDGWRAGAFQEDWSDEVEARGPTPIAALLALADALRERSGE